MVIPLTLTQKSRQHFSYLTFLCYFKRCFFRFISSLCYFFTWSDCFDIWQRVVSQSMSCQKRTTRLCVCVCVRESERVLVCPSVSISGWTDENTDEYPSMAGSGNKQNSKSSKQVCSYSVVTAKLISAIVFVCVVVRFILFIIRSQTHTYTHTHTCVATFSYAD